MVDLWTVDSVSEDWARIESPEGASLQFPSNWLPLETREGDLLKVSVNDDGPRRLVILERDTEATQERQKRMEALRAAIPRGPSGDVDL